MGWTDHTLGYYAEVNTKEINFVLGYYVFCDLKRYGKLSSASSLLGDIKD